MSTITPTLLPQAPIFPTLLPDVPKPHPTPLPPHTGHPASRLANRRNWRLEMDDLSDEETDLDETWRENVRNRGFTNLYVIGKLLTQQEEKNDQAETDSEESGSVRSGGAQSNMEDGENESAPDLDANMEDLDEEQGDVTGEVEDVEDDMDDYDESQEV